MSKEIRKPTDKDRTYTTFIEYGLEEIDVVKVTIVKSTLRLASLTVAPPFPVMT